MTSPQHPSLLASRVIQGRTVNASLSTAFENDAWDDFLRSDSVGQFQQSSAWSQSKQSQGWQCLRVTLEQEGGIVGGFQMLWKSTRLGRVGYVSKGPALSPAVVELESFALDVLIGLTRSHRLIAIVAQPPDHSPALVDALQNRGFARNRMLNVIDATLWVDLSGPPGAWEARLRGSRRGDIRKAQRLGVKIHEGSDADLPVFFDLMVSSCQRQGVHPNPPTLEALTELVQAFGKHGESRLAFAVCQGEMVAATLDLKFGKRFTTWKKGWNGQHAKQEPNVILTHHSMQKAYELGCTYFDFAGVARPLAEALLAGKPLTEAQQHHYDSFKMGFGGRPQLLPPAMIYFRNPLLRFACRRISAWM